MSELTKEQEKTWGGICHFSGLSGSIIPFSNTIGSLVVCMDNI